MIGMSIEQGVRCVLFTLFGGIGYWAPVGVELRMFVQECGRCRRRGLSGVDLSGVLTPDVVRIRFL